MKKIIVFIVMILCSSCGSYTGFKQKANGKVVPKRFKSRKHCQTKKMKLIRKQIRKVNR